MGLVTVFFGNGFLAYCVIVCESYNIYHTELPEIGYYCRLQICWPRNEVFYMVIFEIFYMLINFNSHFRISY